MERQRINLAFVGSGAWARRYHFPTLRYLLTTPPEAFDVDLHMQGIYSLEPETARSVAAQVGFRHVYPSLDALLADPDVDAIAVAVTPTAARRVIEQVAARGVPIFSEKPPGVTTAEARALAEIVDVPNVLAFNRRYAPLNVIYKELVDALEDAYFVEGHFLRYERLEDAFMVGTGIHWINFMEYVCGEIGEVRVERFRSPHPPAWNRVAQMTFANGLRGLLKVFPASGSQVERLEVHGPTRSLYLEGPLWEQPGRIVIDAGDTQEVIEPESTAQSPEIVRLGIAGEYVEFFTRACAGLPTRSNFQNAVNSMRVAEAME